MKRTSSTTWVRGILDMFAAEGVDVDKALAATGIAKESLDDASHRFGADEVSRLWMNAVKTSGKSELGIHPSLAARFVNFEALGYVMLSSPTVGGALDNLGRYMAFISDAATLERKRDGENWWLELGHCGNTIMVPRQRKHYGIAMMLALCQWLTRMPIRPLAVEFEFVEPEDSRAYREVYDCPIRFGVPVSRILFAAADMEVVLPTRSPRMLEMHTKFVQDQLKDLSDAPASQRVREEVIRSLSAGEPLRHEIAARLAMSDRTLQRRLLDENTTFFKLLDETRKELAQKYLSEPDCKIPAIATLLGFGDSSNFYRACKRWFGASPGQLRGEKA